MSTPLTSLEHLQSWEPPPAWQRISTLDLHTAGEPLRVVLGGFPHLEGSTILERRRFLTTHFDRLRTALMWEPRGHREMYGCLVTPPVSPDAHFGVLFMHNEGYSTMCGHGIIAVATAAVTTGMVTPREPDTPVHIDTPAGPVTAYVRIHDGKVGSVRFHNVPSFVVALDEVVDVPGIGTVTYDLAFGGAYYAYVQASQCGLHCLPEEHASLVEAGMAIKRAVMHARPVTHPLEPDLSFLYGTIFVSPPVGHGAHGRNVCVFAEGEVDRSPTGTGVSGRMAIQYARNRVGIGQPYVVESIIGTTFTGRIVRTTTYGGYRAVVPEVEGNAYLTGRHEFWLDPDDPLRGGFFV
jgi:trans-L-3-hydroxyproline dehydratase